MDALRRVDFLEALSVLQEMIGREVQVELNFREPFFGCGLRGRFEAVHSLPPDSSDSAVLLELSGGEGLYLNPKDVLEALVGVASGGSRWLEFHLLIGAVVTFEQARVP
jgi:hypothetical protein